MPLSELLRPQSLDQVIGQRHLFETGGILHSMGASPRLHSMILWGPPGCGKTTLARLLGKKPDYVSVELSALESGVQEIRTLFKQAHVVRQQHKTMFLFVDEIHRLNRSQQDVFLHALEEGDIVLCGVTTENPSFELNGALLSRCQVIPLKSLTIEDLRLLLTRCEEYLGQSLPLTPEAQKVFLDLADGDGRVLVNQVAFLQSLMHTSPLDPQQLLKLLQKKPALYDKNRDAHYDLISTLHKSIRASDVDGALYWLARMLEGGENPLYILRRLMRCALEDVGMADPQALVQAVAIDQNYRRLGSPEGDLGLYQLAIYLATAPKSNAIYKAAQQAKNLAKKCSSLKPPLHALNGSTKVMKDLGYGQGYIYDHDTPQGFSGQGYFPEELAQQVLYSPIERGFERDIIKRLEYWKKLKGKK